MSKDKSKDEALNELLELARAQGNARGILDARIVDELPSSVGVPSSFGAPGGRWLHIRFEGPDFSYLNQQVANDRRQVLREDAEAVRASAARAEAAEEPKEEKRFALLEIDE